MHSTASPNVESYTLEHWRRDCTILTSCSDDPRCNEPRLLDEVHFAVEALT